VIDGQSVDRIDFSLPRGAVIFGRVVDEDGVPFPEVAVSALQYRLVGGKRRVVPVREMVRTNDLGEFRLFGLDPGEYYVSAIYRAAAGDSADGRYGDGAYVPMYFPGTFVLTEAQRISLSASQDVAADFQLLPFRGRRVSGVAMTASGGRIATGGVRIRPIGDGIEADIRTTAVGPEGSFRFMGVSPGAYIVSVIGAGTAEPGRGSGAGGSPKQEFGQLSVVVTTEDIEDLQLTAAPGGTIRGRITFDRIAPSAGGAQGARAVCGPSGSDTQAPGARSVAVRADGFFELTDVFGPCVIGAFMPNWTVKAIKRGDDDIMDNPIDVASGKVIEGIDIVFTDADSGLAGSVTAGDSKDVPDFTVIVFPADQGAWRFPSRRIRTARPDQNMKFRITGLPAGEYLAVAVVEGDESAAQDRNQLDLLRTVSTQISISEGTIRSVALRLVPRGGS